MRRALALILLVVGMIVMLGSLEARPLSSATSSGSEIVVQRGGGNPAGPDSGHP